MTRILSDVLAVLAAAFLAGAAGEWYGAQTVRGIAAMLLAAACLVRWWPW